MKELNRFRQFLTEGDKDHKHTYKQIDPDGTAECTKCGLRNSDPSKTGEKVVKENKYDIEDPESPMYALEDNDQDVAILNNMTSKYGKDVVLMWLSSGEYGDQEYFEEGKLLKEESIKDIENSWHGVIEILYSKDDFKKIMNAKKFEDLEEREQALIGRALKRWERESGKNMNVADYFKAVRNDLTTLSKNL